MARVELRLPQHLENLSEPATVSTIYHGAGEPVRKGEPVLELLNGEGIFDVPAPVTGIIVEIAVRAGDKVSARTTLLVMESGEKGAGPVAGPGGGRASGPGRGRE
ncbi:MAG TPA: lipoyl domain-containing protein [Planctomycetota bacterium]|nr:lipoyl domain-containing protein [Planctomycetota bacterium]